MISDADKVLEKSKHDFISLYNVSESHYNDNQIRLKRYIRQENINF